MTQIVITVGSTSLALTASTEHGVSVLPCWLDLRLHLTEMTQIVITVGLTSLAFTASTEQGVAPAGFDLRLHLTEMTQIVITVGLTFKSSRRFRSRCTLSLHNLLTGWVI